MKRLCFLLIFFPITIAFICAPSVGAACGTEGDSCQIQNGRGGSLDSCCTNQGLQCNKTSGGTCVKKQSLYCSCGATNDPNDSGKTNQFTCTLNGGSVTAACLTNGWLCYNEPHYTAAPRPDIFGGISFSGVHCQTPKFPKFPPVPTPPCAQLVNDRCLSVVTGLGNISTNPETFIAKVFSIFLAATGGIALILIIRSGYSIMTARGNAEGLQHGREQLVAAIVGLLFLIFSFILLQVIGNDLLKINLPIPGA